MSLKLPANFENDIQGRDTALVPVVILSKKRSALSDDYPVDFYRGEDGNPQFLAISTNQMQLSYAKNYTDYFNYEYTGGDESYWIPSKILQLNLYF